jgi:hypothetical protein
MALSRSAALSTPAAIRYGGGHIGIWLEPSIGSGSPRRDSAHPIPARIPQLGQKPSSARVNSLFGRERPGDCFQWNVKVAGPKFSNTPPSMTTLAMRSSDCIHRKPADQPYVSTRRFPSRNYRPITTPNSHSYLRSQANRRMWPRYIKPRCPSRTGKSNGVTVSMKRNYWISRYLPSSHNVRRGFFTRSAIIVLQRIT